MMKSNPTKKLAIPALLLLLLNGCSTLEGLFTSTDGKLTRRYKTASVIDSDAEIANKIAVNAYSFNSEPTSPASKKTVFDFTEKGQKQLIEALDNNTDKNDDLIKSLTSYFSPAGSSQAPAIDVRTTFKKRIVFTVRNKSPMPADRISKLFVTLTALPKAGAKPQATFKFTNCSLLASDFETVDVGKLTYNRNSAFTSNLSAGTGVTGSRKATTGNTMGNSSGTGNEESDAKTGAESTSTNGTETIAGFENKVGGSIGFNRNTSFNEEVLLKQQFVKLSGSVTEKTLSVYQETTSGIDLSGNIIADVEFKLIAKSVTQPVFRFVNAKDTVTKNKLVMGITHVLYPDASEDYRAKIDFDAVYRKVTKRDKSISESDDAVTFYTGIGKAADSIVMLTREEIMPDFWEIAFPVSGQDYSYLKISGGLFGTDRVKLLFSDLDEAKQFLAWLKIRKADFTDGKIGVGGLYTLYRGQESTDPTLNKTQAFENFFIHKLDKPN